MREAVVVAYGRTAVGKSFKGSLKHTSPVDFTGQLIEGVLKKVPALDFNEIDDVILGCAIQEASQSMNIARNSAQRAGLPDSVPGQTVNRFCASGLQAIAAAANSIIAGQSEVVIAGGVETMTKVPMPGYTWFPDPWLAENRPGGYTAMGVTAQNIAERYNISREDQDSFAVESHRRAGISEDKGIFAEEIIPVKAIDMNGKEFIFEKDEFIRRETNQEVLGNLKPLFRVKGSVTAGNSSPLSDGASCMVLMSREKAEELGIEPLAKFITYAVSGVDPEYMGIGPIKAIPKALDLAKVTKDDFDVIELNEAFASQALACIRTLGLDESKINPHGGALSLGHPLGSTGCTLAIKAINELKRTDGKRALVSMCVGGGQGAAGIFERL